MAKTYWEPRSQLLPDSTHVTGLISTASDLLRLGELILNNSNDLAPSTYLNSLNEPGCADNPAWNRCWWNNHGDFFRVPMRENKKITGPAIAGLPGDALALRGAVENLLLIVPSRTLVIARTAVAPTTGRKPPRFESELWKILELS